MKKIFFGLFLLTFCSVLWAVDNPNVRSPVGSPTTPPSVGGGGLVRSPAYNAYGGNDIVTGNVGGMHHFRGVVPYGSQFYHSRSAYSPVDEFLRRSADPIVNDRSPGQYRPYYEPRRVASSAVSAYGGRMNVPEPSAQGQIDPYKPPMLPQLKDTPFYNRPRPLSASQSQLDRILARQYEIGRDRLADAKDKKSASETEKTADTPRSFFETYLIPQQPQTQQKPTEPQPDDQTPQEKQTQPDESQDQAAADSGQPKPAPRDPLLEQYLQTTTVKTDAPELTDQERQVARALLNQYGSYENLAAARLTEYLRQGETLLAQGQFYKAADTFALAGLWGGADARPLAGQAFALFGAGEYMSSAFYLSQAIERNPQVAAAPVALDKLMASRDAYENRVIEMVEWQRKSNSGELAFLLAFVYHQDNKPQQAASFIAIAAERLTSSKAVAILREAIESRAASPAGQ